MKKRLPGFFTGFLSALLLLALAVPAAALITSKTTIEVGPISIMVNGEVFQPTDVNGDPVDVFVYHGTTYAPLRALAEAYGLEVGYDEASRTATVTDPKAKPVEPTEDGVYDYSDWSEEKEAEYQEFMAMWEISDPVYVTDSREYIPYHGYAFTIKEGYAFDWNGVYVDTEAYPDFDDYIYRFAMESQGSTKNIFIRFDIEKRGFIWKRVTHN